MGRAKITAQNVAPQHWALVAAFLGAIAVKIVTLDDSWEHAAKPSFWGAVLLELSVFIGALFSPRIDTRRDTRRDDLVYRPVRPPKLPQ